jgi:superfamily II DNA helicase RecQ
LQYYNFISANRIDCEVYHADIPLNKRNTVHENFVKDKLQIVVATVAFGMGIDKPGNFLIYFT